MTMTNFQIQVALGILALVLLVLAFWAGRLSTHQRNRKKRWWGFLLRRVCIGVGLLAGVFFIKKELDIDQAIYVGWFLCLLLTIIIGHASRSIDKTTLDVKTGNRYKSK